MTEDSNLEKYEDAALLAFLDAVVGDLGRVGAAEAMGVNFRTLRECVDSRRVTRRIREALENYWNGGPVVSHRTSEAGNTVWEDGKGKTLAQLVADLETENRELRNAIEEMGQKVADLDAEFQKSEKVNETYQAHLRDLHRWVGALVNFDLEDGLLRRTGIAKRSRDKKNISTGFAFPPKPGVVTLNHQLYEEEELGEAAETVAVWREAVWAEIVYRDPIEPFRAKVRRLQAERDLSWLHELNLPPEMEPLHYQTRVNEKSKRESDLAKAKEELEKRRKPK